MTPHLPDESCFRPASALVEGVWRPLAIPALARALRGRRLPPPVDRPCEPCEVDYERAARELRARRLRHRRRDEQIGARS